MRNFAYKFLSKINLNSDEKNSLRVLAYHTVPDRAAFSAQLKYLKSSYNIVSLNDLKDFFKGKKVLPERALLITFDDGDVSVLQNGLPALREIGFPSVLFVITSLIDTQEYFWCRLVEEFFKREGKSYAEARKKVNYLKEVSESDRRNYLEKLPNLQAPQLKTNDLQGMNNHDMFIANHTHTHPMINKCSTDQIIEEMKWAKAKFKEMSMIENFSIFAYPNGNWEPHSEELLKNQGIKMAFLFDHKINMNIQNIDPMRISRIRVNADDNLSEFKVKVSGLHSSLMQIKNKILN